MAVRALVITSTAAGIVAGTGTGAKAHLHPEVAVHQKQL